MEDGLTKQKNRLLYITLFKNNYLNFCKLDKQTLNLPWLDLPFQDIQSLTFSQPNIFAFRSPKNKIIIEECLNIFENTNDFYRIKSRKEIKNGIRALSKIFAESMGITNSTAFINFDIDYKKGETPLAEVFSLGFVYHNILDAYQIQELQSIPFDYYSREIVYNISHEFTHIKQMALFKKMCNGEKIPQFDEFCIRFDLMAEFVEEYYYRTDQESKFPQLSIYCTNPCEIIARANSFFFMQELIKTLPTNKQVLWQKSQESMLKNDLQTYLEINIHETLKDNFDFIINQFNEIYCDTKMGQKMIADFQKLNIPLIYSQFDAIHTHIDKLAETVVPDTDETVSLNLTKHYNSKNTCATNIENLQNFKS